ncbi:heavy metal translocating P-type ATPase [Kamptonema formosum]|uniref:heavy metal translocating P-type ATPase n=1 Tax=Kamptonema formosum TaxID=331992 RepID=UPI00034578C2|nr:heavy metal translocating P-type ATPase [Oscillatoria sp. PCC 10802]
MQLSPETAKAQGARPKAGAKAPPAREIITLDVAGMKCAGCVRAVERQLAQHPGVVSASVNLATEVARVECEAGSVEPADLAKRLTSTGFPTQLRDSGLGSSAGSTSQADRQRQEIQQQLWRLGIALALILLSGIGHLGGLLGGEIPLLSNLWFHWGLATAALLGPGRTILVSGGVSLWRNAPNMNTLVGLGSLSSYLASCAALLFPALQWECFFDEPVMMLGFILLGRTAEQLARQRAAAALQALMALQPAAARLVPNPASNSSAEGVEIPVADVRTGEWLRVLPGEKIPVDGEVAAGSTTVDESALTGESVPVRKLPGAQVAAGTLNQSGAIVMRATRTGADTTLAQIVALVEEAQTRKAPVQLLADTVAGYFTYGVITAAALTFLFWYFAGTHLWPDVLGHAAPAPAAALLSHSHMLSGAVGAIAGHTSPLLLSLKLAIAVTVIACPCALGLATPTAIMVGTGIGAERGLLIRGGDILEHVFRVNTVVFDKTGTLTAGQPEVTECLLFAHSDLFSLSNREREENSQKYLLQLAATVESGTRHPLGVAIVREASRLGLSPLPAEDFYTEPGLGASARAGGVQVVLGSADWLGQLGVPVSEAAAQQAQELASQGKTVVYVAVGGALAGLIACADTLRSDASATVEKLRQMGLRVMLLTGDRPEAARSIAQSLGLAAEDVIAGLRPEGKAAAIAGLQSMGQRVAMVGDGINDAPALAIADAGIALHSGTGVAVETAGIVLVRDKLMDVVESIQLSRRTFIKIRQNLFWAFAYNSLGIPLAAGALLPAFGIALGPAAAGALMAFSSVSVVANSLLLRRQ